MAAISQDPKWHTFHKYFVRVVESAPEASPCLRASIASVATRLVQSGLGEIVDLSFLDEGDFQALGFDEFEQELVAQGKRQAAAFRDSWVLGTATNGEMTTVPPLEPRRLQFSATSSTGIRAQTAHASMALVTIGGPSDEASIPETASHQSTEAKRFHHFFEKANQFFCECLRSSPRGQEILRNTGNGGVGGMEVPVEHRDVLHWMFQGKSKSVEFCEQRLMEARRLLQYIG